MSVRTLIGSLFTAITLPLLCLPALAQDSNGDGLSDAYELAFPPIEFSCMEGDSCASVPGCALQSYGGHNYLLCGDTMD